MMVLNSARLRSLTCLLLVAALACIGSPALAQDPASPQSSKEVQQELLKLQRQIFDVLRGGVVGNRDSEFKRYLTLNLKLWTFPDVQSDIPSQRKRLGATVFRGTGNAPNPEAHKMANQHVLPILKSMAYDANKESFSMAVRFNAMLQIADLNEKESDKLGRGVEIPLPAAYPILLQAFQEPADALPDSVRVAALLGLVRHARPGLESKPPLQNALLATVKQKEPTSTRDEQAHDWVRARAIQGLAKLGSAGTDNSKADVLEAVLTVLEDKQESLWLRAQAAASLENMNLKQPGGLNLSRIGRALGQLALEASEAKLPQRTLKERLYSIRLGLTGPTLNEQNRPTGRDEIKGLLLAAIGTSHEAYVKQLVAELDAVEKPFGLIGSAADKFDEEFAKAQTSLKEWLQSNPLQSTQLTAAS